jgi:AcrR family transcriptional regulator
MAGPRNAAGNEERLTEVVAAAGRPHPPAIESLEPVQRARRARIVDSAIELMRRTEYDRIQMKDVSAAAGVALGTTYRYFASKEQLLAEALLVWSDRFPALEGPAAREGDPPAQLKKAFRRAARAFEPNPAVYGTILVLHSSKDPVAAALFDQFAARRREAFAQYLPDVPSPRRERIVDVMSAVLDASLRGWALRGKPIATVYQALDSAAELLLGNGSSGA